MSAFSNVLVNFENEIVTSINVQTIVSKNLLYIKDIIILPLKSCICICAETTFLWEFNFRFFQVLFLQQCTVGCRSQKLDAIKNFLIKLFLPYAFEELS